MTGSNPQMTTAVHAIDEPGALAAAAAVIAGGGCVAVPTETVYGLAADATSPEAVAGIYAAKGRPSFNPLIVHVADLAMARRYADVSPVAERLANAFWPGALTMVLPLRADANLAPAVTAGLGSVALRCPAHPAMCALIGASSLPLAAPSANASGTVSPTTATHVARTLTGRIDMILDGGACTAGIESTIVRVEDARLVLLRPGPVTAEMLSAATGLPVEQDSSGKVTAPGQLASHYAPGKPVLLDCTDAPDDAFSIRFGRGGGDYVLSESGDLAEAAARLFDALHAGAISAHPRIAIDPIPNEGVGIAINDRLRRAAA